MSEFVMVKRELLKRALRADASKGANALQLCDGWNAMEELRAVLAQEAGTVEPDMFMVVTPRVVINGEVTEWWPSVVVYTRKELSELVGPYKVVKRLYEWPPLPQDE